MTCVPFIVPIDVLMDNVDSDKTRVRLLLTCKRLYGYRTRFAVLWQTDRLMRNLRPATAQRLLEMLQVALQNPRYRSEVHTQLRTTVLLRHVLKIVRWTICDHHPAAPPLRRLLLGADILARSAVWDDMWRECASTTNAEALRDFTDARQGPMSAGFAKGGIGLIMQTMSALEQKRDCLEIVLRKIEPTVRPPNLLKAIPKRWMSSIFQTETLLRTYLQCNHLSAAELHQLAEQLHRANVVPHVRIMDQFLADAVDTTPVQWYSWYLMSDRVPLACDVLRSDDGTWLPTKKALSYCPKLVRDCSHDLRNLLRVRDDVCDHAYLVLIICLRARFDTMALLHEYAPHASLRELVDVLELGIGMPGGNQVVQDVLQTRLDEHLMDNTSDVLTVCVDLGLFRCQHTRSLAVLRHCISGHQCDAQVLQYMVANRSTLFAAPSYDVREALCDTFVHHARIVCTSSPDRFVALLTDFYTMASGRRIPFSLINKFARETYQGQDVYRDEIRHLFSVIMEDDNGLSEALSVGRELRVGRVLTVEDMHALYVAHYTTSFDEAGVERTENHWQFLNQYLVDTGSPHAHSRPAPPMPCAPDQAQLAQAVARSVVAGNVEHVQTFARYLNAPAYFELSFASACAQNAGGDAPVCDKITAAFQALIECRTWPFPQRSANRLFIAAQNANAREAMLALTRSLRVAAFCFHD